MGRKRTPGLRLRNGVWHIDKQLKGFGRLYESCGTGDLEQAEAYLFRRAEEIRQFAIFGVRPCRLWREAATKYLCENKHKASNADDARHLLQLEPFIGALPLEDVHDETLRPFVAAQQSRGIRSKSVNNALGIVRRVLNLATRSWRHKTGNTWLAQAPMVTMLPVRDSRRAYPLSWEEQRRLFRELPTHLHRMALFKVNTGTREQEVCQLAWDWEVEIPELGSSVFVVPWELVKNREDRVIVLNRVAKSIVEELRGVHPERVFTFRSAPVASMHNTAWKEAWKRAKLPGHRDVSRGVHNLKHTFGRRLRAAGVPLETRRVLLGHTNGDITTHYSAPELQELIDATEKVCSGAAPGLVVIKGSVG